jgi:uncharacterized membrane protein YdjX (TVP38/TMEM64 family)
MSARSYSWKFIPLIFILHLSFQLLVIYNTSYKLPAFTTIGFPTNFDKAKLFAETFRGYLHTNYVDLLLFQFSNFVFLQTWCIPGTFMFNLLGGALFGMEVGFPLCILCNTLGALNAFLLSKFFLKDVVMTKFSDKVKMLKAKIQEHEKDLFFYLVSSRVFPGSPNWAMNLSFPHLNIPIFYFIGSVAFGLIPWNFFTCKAGLVISTFKSKDEIVDSSTYWTLIGLAGLFLMPPIVRRISNMFNKTEKIH